MLEGSAPPPVQISQPGEIRKEFEKSQALLDQDLKVKQDAELKASEELIRQMQVRIDNFLLREKSLECKQKMGMGPSGGRHY